MPRGHKTIKLSTGTMRLELNIVSQRRDKGPLEQAAAPEQINSKAIQVPRSAREKIRITRMRPERCKKLLLSRTHQVRASRATQQSTKIGHEIKVWCALLATLLLYTLQADCRQLKVTIAIPELVKLNDAFWLNCSHDSPPKSLAMFASNVNYQQAQQERTREERFRDIYSISWYKDDTEFYRFEPSAASAHAKAGKFWPTSGVQPDKSKSFEGNVYLTKADVMSEGTYRCEIVADHSFETVRKSKHLKVFALPVRGPRIEILDAHGRPKNPKEQEISYEVGDKIVLRCNSNPSKPAARLRWYLNDREVLVPNSHALLSSAAHLADRPTEGPTPTNVRYATRAPNHHQTPLGYNVQVTPIEYRNHYKGIYSSHSNLSVVLERDDLVNSRISFKCLASMRQEVTVPSKQLILLTPQSVDSDNLQAAGRARRSPDQSARHRVQYNNQRSLPPVPLYHKQTDQTIADKASKLLAALNESRRLESDIRAADQDQRSQMMYIYEDSDSTLGPSIVDNPRTLDVYLSSLANESDRQSNNVASGVVSSSESQVLGFNRADNLEYMHVLREKWQQHRQRSLSATGGQSLAHHLPQAQVGVGGTTSGHKRLYGPSAVVKSPFYLDENDPFRPVINWPPLDSGKLMLLPAAQTLVAVPTATAWQYAAGGSGADSNELRFFMPPRESNVASSAADDAMTPENTSRMILERLIDSLNCTCTEGSLDSKLGWIVNEHSLTSRDVRHYPTRISPDHRQTWISIGLQAAGHTTATSQLHQPANSLASILSQYYKQVEALARVGKSAALRSRPSSIPGANLGQRVPLVGNEQLKFMCQAEHSMLLYSSSEMITFDFGGTLPLPPPPSATQSPNNEIDNNNSIVDKLSSSSATNKHPSRGGDIHMVLLMLLFCWHCCSWPRYFRVERRL